MGAGLQIIVEEPLAAFDWEHTRVGLNTIRHRGMGEGFIRVVAQAILSDQGINCAILSKAEDVPTPGISICYGEPSIRPG
jgi:hypothetical protein